MGLANYYQWFIKNFVVIVKLLHNLVKKDQKWNWKEKQESVFRELNYVTREILSMECENERWRSIAFLSKSLNETEKNYEIHDKEMLVVIKRLEN